MIYNDGYEVDENLKFVKCPKCGNEQYSDGARYCRICGFYVYNECEGDFDRDEYGNQGEYHIHRNLGNARFCEFCGQPTMLFKEKLLKPYTEVQTEEDEDSFPFDEALPFN
ncbi:hypothetical protein HW273_01730 [Oribacterium sp. oral taxon 102]|uniref:hypothetical protein n=1 Tax=Oribacterium sp. oral taxon 102 TaxID=671214 RepID=UPI0015BBDBAD|nr:hypothetical protein [Oribacterium sp. oral taxon 102]NWO20627.1 hypothetical protein [Oribacterium sp. oral taxon 102]